MINSNCVCSYGNGNIYMAITYNGCCCLHVYSTNVALHYTTRTCIPVFPSSVPTCNEGSDLWTTYNSFFVRERRWCGCLAFGLRSMGSNPGPVATILDIGYCISCC